MAKLLSMPVSASLYPEPPYLYPKAELAVIFYSVDRDAVEHIVPAPLKLARTPMCVAFVAWYPETTIGPYHEAATFIEAKLKTDEGKVSAFYCNAMFVDCDIALAAGREIWGFPKKLAEMSVKREGSTVVGLLRRKNVDVMKITVNLETKMETPSMPELSTITLKQMFKPDGSGLELQEFIKTTMPIEALEITTGTTEIKFQESKEDPLYRLAPKTTMPGMFGIANLTLPYGKVFWRANP